MNVSKDDRKKAIEEYRNRPVHRGVFAVRCLATGRAWVGAAPDLDAAKNGAWFTLRTGSHRDAALQTEWRAHGEDQFRFDVLEEIDPETPQLLLSDVFKAKKAEWARREGALLLLP